MQEIFFEILKLCGFDFYQTEGIFGALFDFKESEPISDAFEEATFDSSTFVVGLGVTFFFMMAFPVYKLSHMVSVYLCKDKVTKSCLVSWT